jgi:hypothetical protein
MTCSIIEERANATPQALIAWRSHGGEQHQPTRPLPHRRGDFGEAAKLLARRLAHIVGSIVAFEHISDGGRFPAGDVPAPQ